MAKNYSYKIIFTKEYYWFNQEHERYFKSFVDINFNLKSKILENSNIYKLHRVYQDET